MTIYDSNHTGRTLSTLEMNNLALNPDDLRGYFFNEDLQSIINQASCVGVRIYNINRSNQPSQLVAVGVDEDGMEPANSIHRFSHPTDNPISNNTASSATTRNDVVSSVLPGSIPDSEQYSSFFSKDMINELITNSSLQGIAFYHISLRDISDDPGNPFQPHISQLNNSVGLRTHLAVTSNVVNGNIEGIENVLSDNRLSDLPCPGHCAEQDNSGSTSRVDNPDKFATSGPYIPIW